MPTYLVTGAAGFIGSNFVHYLLSDIAGAEVVALDNLGFAANLANLDTVRDQIRFVEADIADLHVMQAVYEEFEPDYVVNFAAESHNDRAIVDPSSFMRANALGAQVLLECSRQRPVRTHLHVSTIEVYGELPHDRQYFDESSPLNAKTPYSAAKAAGDQIVRAYMQTYPRMDIRMTHCANNYGPYQLPEKLIPLAVTNVLRGRKIPVYGDGLQRRDWLHVLDHCRAIHAVLTAEPAPFGQEAATRPEQLPIYDVSARHEVTNLAIAELILQRLGKDPAEWIEHVADRPNHDRRYLIEPAKLEGELGWRPVVDFATALGETVDWYVANEAWWQDILRRKGDLQIAWATVS
ncbi:MAG TPA: dTDP-glucose 4,6-dehydratase [Trebonia sp.]|nr:dTDP-glucose 4,6-dehydratase [Trebonia sp.]